MTMVIHWLVNREACGYGARGVGRTVAAFLTKWGGKSGLLADEVPGNAWAA